MISLSDISYALIQKALFAASNLTKIQNKKQNGRTIFIATNVYNKRVIVLILVNTAPRWDIYGCSQAYIL